MRYLIYIYLSHNRHRKMCVLSVTDLDLSYALPADLFRCHARSPKRHSHVKIAVRFTEPPAKVVWDRTSRLVTVAQTVQLKFLHMSFAPEARRKLAGGGAQRNHRKR